MVWFILVCHEFQFCGGVAQLALVQLCLACCGSTYNFGSAMVQLTVVQLTVVQLWFSLHWFSFVWLAVVQLTTLVQLWLS